MKADELDILVKKCIEHDRTSQATLYELFCRKMFALCIRYSQNQEEAEDTLQDGFVKVFENLKNYKNEGSLEGWIRRIMVNTAIQKFRKSSARPKEVSIDGEEWVHGSEGNTISDLGSKELIKLIQQLPPKCRLVFNLFAIEGYNHREISAQLGISEGTSKSNLHDARKMLQKALNQIEKTELIQR